VVQSSRDLFVIIPSSKKINIVDAIHVVICVHKEIKTNLSRRYNSNLLLEFKAR
jgi:hypothetical protein